MIIYKILNRERNGKRMKKKLFVFISIFMIIFFSGWVLATEDTEGTYVSEEETTTNSVIEPREGEDYSIEPISVISSQTTEQEKCNVKLIYTLEIGIILIIVLIISLSALCRKKNNNNIKEGNNKKEESEKIEKTEDKKSV